MRSLGYAALLCKELMRLLFEIAKQKAVKLYKVNAHVMGVGLTMFDNKTFGDA